MRIIRNRAQCLRCDDIIESTHRHHFVRCNCGALAVDGGRDYTRRLYTETVPWEEMSEHSEPAGADCGA